MKRTGLGAIHRTSTNARPSLLGHPSDGPEHMGARVALVLLEKGDIIVKKREPKKARIESF
mgnify:CR=1 FL=1